MSTTSTQIEKIIEIANQAKEDKLKKAMQILEIYTKLDSVNQVERLKALRDSFDRSSHI